MIWTETEIIARISTLEVQVLEEWVAAGWVKPRPADQGLAFDDMDVARVQLLCDLRYEMGLGEQELSMVVSLVDQLHGTRQLLRAMTSAVAEQPQTVRDAIAAHVERHLKAKPDRI